MAQRGLDVAPDHVRPIFATSCRNDRARRSCGLWRRTVGAERSGRASAPRGKRRLSWFEAADASADPWYPPTCALNWTMSQANP